MLQNCTLSNIYSGEFYVVGILLHTHKYQPQSVDGKTESQIWKDLPKLTQSDNTELGTNQFHLIGPVG